MSNTNNVSLTCLSFRKCEVDAPQVRPRVLRPLSAGVSEAQAGVPRLQGRGQEGRAQSALPLAGAQGGGAGGEISGGGINSLDLPKISVYLKALLYTCTLIISYFILLHHNNNNKHKII